MVCSVCGGNILVSQDQCVSWCDTCGRHTDLVKGFVMDGDVDSCEKCGNKLSMSYDGDIICDKCFSNVEDQDINSYGIYLYDKIKELKDDVVFPLKYKIKDNTGYILYSNDETQVVKDIKEFVKEFMELEEVFYSYKKMSWIICDTKLTIGEKEHLAVVNDRFMMDRYSFIAFIHNIYWNI